MVDNGSGVNSPQESWLGWALAFYGALFAVAAFWATAVGRPLWYAGAEAAEHGGRPALDLATGLAAGVLLVGLSALSTRHTRWGRELARALRETLGPLGAAQCWGLAALSGIAEEAFFRGALQPAVGWVAASLIFGLAHFAPRRELLPWTLFSLAAGFLLGALFEFTGNLLAPIATHVVVNGINLTRLTR